MNKLRQRLWYWLLVDRLPFIGGSRVANRFIRTGFLGVLEFTVTIRDPRQEDGYSREELLNLLKLIRVQEEKQNWKVPEPVPCEHCIHVSPVTPDGKCPVVVFANDRPPGRAKGMPCLCDQHASGLVSAWRKNVDMMLRRGNWPPIAPAPPDEYTINPSAASTGSLQDG